MRAALAHVPIVKKAPGDVLQRRREPNGPPKTCFQVLPQRALEKGFFFRRVGLRKHPRLKSRELKHAASRFTWHVAIFFMHCIGFYFHVPAGVHGQARAPEPSALERAGPPPRRRRSCDSPKSRTARRQPHPPQPSGPTPTSAFAAATAQPTRSPGQTPRYSRPLIHGG